jgi:hypothetical protein
LKPKTIYSVYCAKEISGIVREQGRRLENAIVDVKLVSPRPSLKKIMQKQARDCPLKNGDRIITIDSPPKCIFLRDISDSRLICFPGMDEFAEWIIKLMTDQHLRGGGYIEHE